jgi:hypothetical protein
MCYGQRQPALRPKHVVQPPPESDQPPGWDA